jgi:hypothetical protein
METYVVIGHHYWDKGSTIDEAKKVFRREGGQLIKGYVILTFDAETQFFGVDSHGYYEYKGHAPTITKINARTAR